MVDLVKINALPGSDSGEAGPLYVNAAEVSQIEQSGIQGKSRIRMRSGSTYLVSGTVDEAAALVVGEKPGKSAKPGSKGEKPEV